ncbi:MAG: hypothetical protein ACON4U_15880 [Myxococcota bacterium]
MIVLTLLMACSDTENSYKCTTDEVLQSCDADGLCEDIEDCAAVGLMCHAEMGHCMAMEETGN